jgi:predicted MFS family arabinose efflux permease
MAAAAGLVVANLYYAQPLLVQIARDLGVSAGRAGLVATATQVGYAVGLLVVVPLADIAERRRLIVALTAAAALALSASALAPGYGALLVAMVAVGIASVVPQVIVPVAAGLARPEARGRVVGAVMSGLLVGILLARTVSGAVGARAGWRAMFWGAAALMVVLAAVLRRSLPESRPAAPTSYRVLMRSLPTVARRYPVLREAGLTGALVFGSFSAFWTTLAFHLARPPLGFGSAAAGAFGLAGAAGALAASLVGRLSDRVSAQRTVALGIAASLLGFGCLALLGTSVVGLVVGVIVLDFGVQCAHVSNQARVFSLDEAARGRINAVYMVTVFVGGALGSTLGAALWTAAGWPGVCAGGAAMVAAAALVHLRGYRRPALG